MEKPSPPSSRSLSSFDGSKELQCVGSLEVVRPKPVGFLCGSIPVPTDKSFHAIDSALVPSRQKVRAPRYRMLPAETDLNTLPVVSNLPEKFLPIGALPCKTTGELIWEGDAVSSNMSRKSETLAVTGLVGYGDEIDVIAPADILKQIFKMQAMTLSESTKKHASPVANAVPGSSNRHGAAAGKLRELYKMSLEVCRFQSVAFHALPVDIIKA